MIGFVDRGDHVDVALRSRAGATTNLRCRYLIAADGGNSSLRTSAGIGEVHHLTYNTFVAAFFHTDLSAYTSGREGALIWSLAPGVEGVFHPLDGKTAWAAHIMVNPKLDNPESWTADRVIERVRRMIGAPAGETPAIDLHRHYSYTMTTAVSERLRKGRLILSGDAAHRTLPFGGWGLNTGIHSAHNLAWKLGAVMRGEAPDALIDTYDHERREAALINCEFGRVNAFHVANLMQALRQSASTAEKRALIAASKQYGNWTGLDLGVHYDCQTEPGAFVPDDVPAPLLENPIIDYVPHAKPGWRAPHFWARSKACRHRVSSVELLGGAFTVLAGPKGEAWCEAARSLKGPPAVAAWRVTADGDLAPEYVDFCALYGISDQGAVLVRPDGHVAFRAQDGADPVERLSAALDRTLMRSGL